MDSDAEKETSSMPVWQPPGGMPTGAGGGGGEDPPLIGKYFIIEAIGGGGMGRIFRAHDTSRGQDVALKIPFLHVPNRAIFESFKREPKLTSAARKATGGVGVIVVLNADVARPSRSVQVKYGLPDLDLPFYVMDLLPDARTLDHDEIRAPRDTGARVRLLAQLCNSIAACHAEPNPIVHADLKPSNVMVSGGPTQTQVTVIDFGLARWAREWSIEGLLGGGTPDYMAPELRDRGGGNPDVKSDVYALGVTCFEILTGKLPREAKLNDADPKQMPPPLHRLVPDADARLSEIVAGALHPNPEKRLRARELADALHEWERSWPRRQLQCFRRWALSNGKTRIAALALVALLAALAALLIGAALHAWTPVPAVIGRTLTMIPGVIRAPANVHVIAVHDWDRARQAIGLPPQSAEQHWLDPSTPVSNRLVWAALADRLRGSDARSVNWDVYFEDPPPSLLTQQPDLATRLDEATSALHGSMVKLIESGVPVQVGYADETVITDRLRDDRRILKGDLVLVATEAGPTSVLAIDSPNRATRAGFAAQAVCARPGAEFVPVISQDDSVVSFKPDRAATQLQPWAVAASIQPITDAREFRGTSVFGNDLLALAPAGSPPDLDAFAGHHSDAADWLAAEEPALQELRRRVQGRIVVLLNLAPGSGDVHNLFGRSVHGGLIQAAAIERLASNRAITVLGPRGRWVACLIAAALGVLVTMTAWILIAWPPVRDERGGKRRGAARTGLLLAMVVLVGVLLIALCAWFFAQDWILVHPTVPLLAFLFGAIGALALPPRVQKAKKPETGA